MDPKPTFESTTRPIPANDKFDPITPSSSAKQPITVTPNPMNTQAGLRDVPGAESNARPFDPRPVGANDAPENDGK